MPPPQPLQTRRDVLSWIGLALGPSGCAMTREFLGKRPEGRRVMAEFDRYAATAEQLRKNHASGPLDDKDVRELLRRVGLGSSPSRPRPDAPPAAPPKSFPVPVYTAGYRWPLDAGLVTSEFGQRRGTAHQGMDIAADRNVPIYAAAEGEVIYADSATGRATGPHLHFEIRESERPVDPRPYLPKSRF